MKKFSILTFLLVCSIVVFSQNITLKILGQHAYTEVAESHGVIITLEENPNKCDPVLGFISIEEQLKHLTESVRATGSKAQLIPIKDHTYSAYRKKTYKIEEPDPAIFDDILTRSSNHQAIIKETFYKLPTHDFSQEDHKAIGAFKDAREKADVIANHLGFQVKKVLNIDDDTTEAGEFYQLAGGDPKKLKQIKELFALFQNRDTNNSKSKSPSRTGKYQLWVTFEISLK